MTKVTKRAVIGLLKDGKKLEEEEVLVVIVNKSTV